MEDAELVSVVESAADLDGDEDTDLGILERVLADEFFEGLPLDELGDDVALLNPWTNTPTAPPTTPSGLNAPL